MTATVHTCGLCSSTFPAAQLTEYIAHLQQHSAQDTQAPRPAAAPASPQRAPRRAVFQQAPYISQNASLRPHQRSTHAQLIEFYKQPEVASVLVCACTGSGKSGTIALAPLAVPACRRVLVVCPNDTIKKGEAACQT